MTAREEQFRQLFAANYLPVLAYALRRSSKRADAEDVVAEALPSPGDGWRSSPRMTTISVCGCTASHGGLWQTIGEA